MSFFSDILDTAQKAADTVFGIRDSYYSGKLAAQGQKTQYQIASQTANLQQALIGAQIAQAQAGADVTRLEAQTRAALAQRDYNMATGGGFVADNAARLTAQFQATSSATKVGLALAAAGVVFAFLQWRKAR